MARNPASGINLSEFEQRMQKLELNIEQNSHKSKPSTPNFKPLNFAPANKGASSSSGRPTSFNPDFVSRKKQISFNLPTNIPPPTKSQESEVVNKRLQEVIQQNGKLRIDGQIIKADVQDFESLGQIGSGTCGQVYRMKYKTRNHIMAVKQMMRSGNREESKRILMDLDVVQKSHDCPHIVTCFGTFVTENSVWICMELMATCFDKLKKKIGPVPENIIGKLTVAVVKALDYLKEHHGVIHRDVKPSNILINQQGQIKLCDFGISGRLVDSQAKTRAAGCAAYMAPERISPDPSHPNYDIRADVWSLGISLVELSTGVFPYYDCKTDFEMLTKILEQTPPTLPTNQNFSIHFQRFVTSCCTKNYANRPKYKVLLRHEFVLHYGQVKVDVASWITSVLNPDKLPQTKTFVSKPEPVKSNDPFAFAAEITQAQFKHSRNKSWSTTTGNKQEFSSDKVQPKSNWTLFS